MELNLQYVGTGYQHPLLLVDLVTGEKVAEARLPAGTDYAYYLHALKPAFHPSRPILTVTDGQSLWLLAVPQGGILYQTRLSDAPETRGRRSTAYHAQLNPRGDLLMLALREVPTGAAGELPRILTQYWDPSVASAARQTLAWNGDVQDVRFAGEDALAVVGGSNPTGVHRRTLQGSGQWETQASWPTGAFDPSGRYFVQMLADRSDVYDAATGKLQKSIARKWPTTAFVLPVDRTQRWIAGVDREGETPRLRLFDVTNLRWTATLLDAGSNPYQVFFDDQSKHVVVSASTPTGDKGGYRFSTTVYRLADGVKVLDLAQAPRETRFTSTGYLLASTLEGTGTVWRAYDLKSGRMTGQVSLRTNTQLWLGSDGKSAAFLTQEGTRHRLSLWPFAEGAEPKQLPLECNSFHSIALFRDRLLVTADVTPTTAGKAPARREYAVQLWDLNPVKLLRSQPAAAFWSVQWSETHGKALVFQTGTVNAPCAVWDLKTGQTLQTLESFRGLSPDTRFAYFAKGVLLDLATMKRRSLSDDSGFGRFKFSPDGRYFIFWPWTRNVWGRVQVLDLHQPGVPWSPAEGSGNATAELSPDSRSIGFIDANAADQLHVYELATGKKRQTISLRHRNARPDQSAVIVGRFSPFWFSPDGSRVAVTVSNQLRLGKTDQPQLHSSLPRTSHQQSVHAVAVSPDGQFLASAGADGTVCFWRAKDGRYLGMLDEGDAGKAALIRRLVFSPRGNLLALRKESGEIAVWKWFRPDDADAEIEAAFLWSNNRVPGRPLAFSPDGRFLAVGEANGAVRLHDAATAALVHWLKPLGAVGAVRGLAFTPDGKRLAVARGQVVALWDVDAGSLWRAWDAQQGPIQDVAYPPDGQVLVTTGRDVRLWDTLTGELQMTLDRQASAVRQATFSPSGQRLAVVVDERSIVVTHVADLLKAVDDLGLRSSAETKPVAWTRPLWMPETQQTIAVENTLAEFLPKAARAERDRDWKQAVAHLTRVLAIEPGNVQWRTRRAVANEQRKDWPAAAVDRSFLLDLQPDDLYRGSQRSLSMLKTFREQPEVFAALEKLRSKDPLFALVRGRELVLQSQWREARSAYGSVIRRIPASEDWFEYAALCLLSGDRKACSDHVAWMAKQEGQPSNEYLNYVYARTAGLAADARLEKGQAIKWGEAGIGKQPRPWTLHAAGLAHYRAGQLDKAKETLQEALKGGWAAHCLNQLALGMVEHEMGNDEAAEKHLKAVRTWQQAIEKSKQNGYVNVQVPDWVEFNVLLPQLEALLAREPRPVKPAPKP